MTSVPGPKSNELHERRQKVVPLGVHSGYPVYIEEAKGGILRDVDGNQFIDLGCGIGVTTLGHCNQEVVDAAKAQLDKYLHTLFTVTPYEPYVELAEKLSTTLPGGHDAKVMFVNAGAEAVENGVKIARAATGRTAVAVLDHSFHGRTNLTMAMNHKGSYATGFGPLAGDVHHAPSSYPFRDGLSGEEAAARTIDFLEKRIGKDDLACLVVEPIQGEGGFMVPADGYLNALVNWCREHGVIFISDEIQSGIARSGKVWASEHFDIEPDLILFAKGIADGVPLAGVLGRKEIMDKAAPGGLGGTFGGNPVSCAAGLAVLNQVVDGDACERAEHVGGRLADGLRKLAETYDIIGEVRGRGAMIAMELVESGTKKPNSAAAKALVKHAFANGLILLDCGTWMNVIRFLPSTQLTDEQIDDALSVIADGFKSL